MIRYLLTLKYFQHPKAAILTREKTNKRSTSHPDGSFLSRLWSWKLLQKATLIYTFWRSFQLPIRSGNWKNLTNDREGIFVWRSSKLGGQFIQKEQNCYNKPSSIFISREYPFKKYVQNTYINSVNTPWPSYSGPLPHSSSK